MTAASQVSNVMLYQENGAGAEDWAKLLFGRQLDALALRPGAHHAIVVSGDHRMFSTLMKVARKMACQWCLSTVGRVLAAMP